MGMYSWDSFGSPKKAALTPRLTVRCEYEDMPPTEVCFCLSPRYGIHDAREAHEWFLCMMREHEEFEGLSSSWEERWTA